MSLGLITEQLEYNYNKKKRSMKVYKAVIQLIGKRRPIGLSLMYLAHIIAEKWNKEFIK